MPFQHKEFCFVRTQLYVEVLTMISGKIEEVIETKDIVRQECNKTKD